MGQLRAGEPGRIWLPRSPYTRVRARGVARARRGGGGVESPPSEGADRVGAREATFAAARITRASTLRLRFFLTDKLAAFFFWPTSIRSAQMHAVGSSSSVIGQGEPLCRICWESVCEANGSGEFLEPTPCSCRDERSNVHQDCLECVPVQRPPKEKSKHNDHRPTSLSGQPFPVSARHAPHRSPARKQTCTTATFPSTRSFPDELTVLPAVSPSTQLGV